MGSAVKKCCAVILTLFLACSDMTLFAAENQSMNAENNIYEVLARSNMRAEPSLDGAWVMTIPQGATVKCMGNDTQEFSKIEYEGVVGYIYSGCIRKIVNATVLPNHEETAARPAERPEEVLADLTATVSIDMDNLSPSRTLSGFGSLTGTITADEGDVPFQSPVQVEVLKNANFRGSPSVQGSWLDTLPKGTTVTVLDEGENGFTHISHQGQSGYIYTKLLDMENSVRSSSGIATTVNTPEMQASNARSGIGGSVLASQRSLQSTNDVATQISVEVQEVAAVSTMVEAQTIIASAARAEAASRTVGASADNMAYEISRRANMRATPSVEGGLLTTLPVGADIIRLGETTDGYTMVQYDGMTGYVLEECISNRVDISRLGSEPVLFTITAYCPCRRCCGNYSPEVTGREAHTATGAVPRQGRTVAVDPTVIPYGTSIHIDGMGDFVAEDCGGGIQQNHIDVYFDSHEAAIAFGTRRLYVSINH